jgi:hypothetical protein
MQNTTAPIEAQCRSPNCTLLALPCVLLFLSTLLWSDALACPAVLCCTVCWSISAVSVLLPCRLLPKNAAYYVVCCSAGAMLTATPKFKPHAQPAAHILVLELPLWCYTTH